MKFNFFSRNQPQAVNHAGAEAYTLTPEVELYTAVACTMLNDTYYEEADNRLLRLRHLISQVDPVFVAQLAIYVREQMHLRSAPVVLLGELTKLHSGDSLVSKAIGRAMQRPDEITELLAYYQLTNRREGVKKLNRLSKQIQKGLSFAFNKFDEYQFAKYDRATSIKLRDALFLVHPKPKDEAQQAIFNKITNGSLTVPYTWETELSALGRLPFKTQQEKTNAFKDKWEELIDSSRLGYMATLRNLRNMLEAGIDTLHTEKVCTYLASEKAVRNSRQLPFRFLSAYRELKPVQSDQVPVVLDALEEAIRISASNIQGFDGTTRVAIACDVSGSMHTPVSKTSKVQLFDVGLLLGMLLQSHCRTVRSGMFGDTWKVINLPTRQVLANVDELRRREGEVGYSTNGYKVLDDLISANYIADKIFFFTDTQLWDSRTNNTDPSQTMKIKWMQYKHLAPNARLYLFDLAGYGKAPLQIEQNDVYLLAGWSDKVFDALQAIEEGRNTVGKIQQLVL